MIGYIHTSHVDFEDSTMDRHWVAHRANSNRKRDVYWNAPGKAVVPAAKTRNVTGK